MEWEELRLIEKELISWLDKFSSITLVSENKRMVEEVKEIFKDKNKNTSALVLKYHRIEELVMRCIHHLTREARLIQLDDALTQLPDQIFAACIPNLSYVELTYHFPNTLSLCARLINRFYKIRKRRKLPIPVIDTLLYQLCVWLFKSTLQEQDYSHYLSEIEDCLAAIQQLEPNLMQRVMNNRNEINSILDSLVIHPYRSTLIEDSIKSKVEGKLTLFKIVTNKLKMLSQREMISVSQMLHEGQRQSAMGVEDFDSFTDPLFTYTQLEERINLSLELLTVVKPLQKQDNLSGLTDSLEKRIESDKATVALIDKLSTHSFDTLIQDEPVDSMLLRYLQGIEILITITGSDDTPVISEVNKQDIFVAEACLIFPEFRSHAEAFYPNTPDGETNSKINPITSSTPLHILQPAMTTIDEIKVSHTPELQTGILIQSPSQLTQLTDAQSIIASSPSPSDMDSHAIQQAEAEIVTLKRRINELEGKLSKSKGNLNELHKREKGLRKKVTVMTKKQIQHESYLQEIYLPQYRRTEVIKRLTNLYMQERLDCSEVIRTAGVSADTTNVILFSIMKTAYEMICAEDTRISQQLKQLLELPDNSITVLSIQESVSCYLRKENVILPSLLPVLKERVVNAVLEEYGQFVSESNTRIVYEFARNSLELSWSILIQSPKLYLSYHDTCYNADTHRRFYSSDHTSECIKHFIWPTLIETGTLRTLCKGIVFT